MTWPRGPDALQPGHPGRAAHLQAAAVHPRARRRRPAGSRRCWSRSATARRSAAGCGSPRAPLLDDGLLDVVIIKPMSKPRPGPDLPQAVQGHPHHPPAVRAPPGPRGHRRRARHRGVRRRRAVRPAAAHRRVRARRADGPGMSADELARPSGTPTPRPARHPVLARLRGALRLPARRLPGPRLPRDRGRAAACWSPRPPARARRSSASSPSTWRSTTGRKCFYTTPIKALSNQKYHDLVARYGAERGRPAHRRQHRQRRGAGRGDDHRGAAQHALRRLADPARPRLRGDGRGALPRRPRSRGAVWEEVIIHLPESVALVSLSATVSNAEEFGEWLATVRGETDDDRRGAAAGAALPARDGRAAAARPVRLLRRRRRRRLRQGGRPGQRRADADRPRRLGQQPADARPPLAAQGQARARRRTRAASATAGGSGSRAGSTSSTGSTARGCCRRSCSSSAGSAATPPCTQCLDAGVRLTTPGGARRRSTSSSRSACRHLPDEDLHVLGYHDFLDGLTRGVAAHHAGMLPAFKQVVEELYVRGLCKVVFATETLALGINMPARTVVIEKLSKWNGETHADITPGEYTQLTGRAGRRGLDVEGHGVVLWQPGHEPARGGRPRLDPHLPAPVVVPAVVQHGGQPGAPVRPGDAPASCSSSRSPSSRPTRPWSGWPGSCARARRRSTGYAEAATCHLGDFMEYAALRRRISRGREGRQPGPPRRPPRRRRSSRCASSSRGDVIEVPTGKFAGFAVVVDPGLVAGRARGPTS